MRTKKIYYHVIEEGREIGWQGYYDTETEAKEVAKHLQGCFNDLYFYVWQSVNETMPEIITI